MARFSERVTHPAVITAAAVAVLGGGLLVWALTGDDAVPAPEDVPATTTSAAEPTPSDEDATPVETPSPSDEPSTPTPSDGPAVWSPADVAPEVFGGVEITGAVAWERSIVAVGCDHELTTSGEPGDGPIWVGSGSQWERVGPVSVPSPTGTEIPVTCVDQVVATPHGLFAAAGFAMIRSTDGLTWESVGLDLDEWVEAILAVGDNVSVLTARASLAESRVATLWSTTDGLAWDRLGGPRSEAGVGDDPAVVFDNGGVADVVAAGGLLVAVGASPGGEFVPTAAAWTSADTLTWQRASVADAEDCYLTAAATATTGLLAAGWCTTTGQPALWTSADGTAWQRTEAPVAELAPYSFVAVGGLSVLADGTVAVAGTVSEAGLEGGTIAQWLGPDGWNRADDVVVPYHVVEGTGFWPPLGTGPVTVLVAE